MNRFEKEILEIIDNFGDKSSIEIRSNADYVFRKLQDNFPVSGSKIDWDNVHPRENLTSPLVPITTHDRIKFFSDNIDKYCLIGRAFLIGDSILDFAMEGDPRDFIFILPKFLEIPQHSYVVHEKFTWCFCFSFEGDVDFGFGVHNI